MELQGKRAYTAYIIVYILLLTKAGFFFVETYSGLTSTLFLFLLIIIGIIRNLSINKNQANVILVLFLFSCLTGFFEGFPDFDRQLLFYFNLCISLLIVNILSFKDFAKCFSNIILLICGASVIGYIFLLMGIPLVKSLPVLLNSKGWGVYFSPIAEFWVEPIDGVFRIQGIFWEPGAFQAMIIIAILLDMYVTHPSKHKLLRYGCYITALLLTYSTTGIISLILLLLLLSVKGKRFKKSSVIILSFLILSLFIIIPILYQKFEGFLFYSTFGKLEMLNNAVSYGENNSATSRYISFILPLKFLIESPLFGLGENGLTLMTSEAGHSMFTCTPINYLAFYGIPCGIMCFYGFIKLLNLSNKSFIEGFLLIAILIATTSSENFAFNPIFTCFMLYGYGQYKLSNSYSA